MFAVRPSLLPVDQVEYVGTVGQAKRVNQVWYSACSCIMVAVSEAPNTGTSERKPVPMCFCQLNIEAEISFIGQAKRSDAQLTRKQRRIPILDTWLNRGRLAYWRVTICQIHLSSFQTTAKAPVRDPRVMMKSAPWIDESKTSFKQDSARGKKSARVNYRSKCKGPGTEDAKQTSSLMVLSWTNWTDNKMIKIWEAPGCIKPHVGCTCKSDRRSSGQTMRGIPV
jgi:hypothetical protein